MADRLSFTRTHIFGFIDRSSKKVQKIVDFLNDQENLQAVETRLNEASPDGSIKKKKAWEIIKEVWRESNKPLRSRDAKAPKSSDVFTLAELRKFEGSYIPAPREPAPPPEQVSWPKRQAEMKDDGYNSFMSIHAARAATREALEQAKNERRQEKKTKANTPPEKATRPILNADGRDPLDGYKTVAYFQSEGRPSRVSPPPISPRHQRDLRDSGVATAQVGMSYSEPVDPQQQIPLEVSENAES